MTTFFIYCLWQQLRRVTVLTRSGAFFAAVWMFATLSHAQLVRMEGIVDAGYSWSRTWIDIDGDGRDDFCAFTGANAVQLECYFSDGSKFSAVKTSFGSIGYGQDPQAFRWTDANGDGRPDLCRVSAGLNGVSQGSVTCWLGPTFTTATTPATIPFRYTAITGGGDSPTVTEFYGLASYADVFFGDVDGDGRADLCYVYSAASAKEFRCQLSDVAGNLGGFVPVTTVWTKTSFDPGALLWPQGFYDFNGDGFADLCRVRNGGVLACTLGGPGGFAGEVASPVISVPYREGAAFVDINGDGKTDFCRIVGTSGNFSLSCKVSNGIGWELTERLSPVITNAQIGDVQNRWWVDINGDGLPDYCRAVESGSLWNFSCRLSRGDGDANSLFAFGFSDVGVANYEPGVSDGGRGFCDATGTGLQTYCRMRVSTVGSTQVCYTGESDTVCWDQPVNSIGLMAGLVDPVALTNPSLQARQPLLTAFSDGTGAETRITYLPMTQKEVYTRSGIGAYPRALLSQPRSSIVYETRAWQAGGTQALTGIARYFFKDLRSDTWAGSRGFRERWIFTEGSNTFDHIVNYQGLGPTYDLGSILDDRREIGLVKYQERFAVANGYLPTPVSSTSAPSVRLAGLKNVLSAARQQITIQPIAPSAASPFMLLQSTTNTLRDTVPINPRFRYVGASTVNSWDWNAMTSIAMPRGDTTSVMSNLGNVASLTQTTTARDGAVWSKTTTNVFGQDNVAAWILGRLTSSTVVSTAPDADTQIAANPRSAGNSANATAMSSPAPSVPQPLSPAVLAAILQLLLDD